MLYPIELQGQLFGSLIAIVGYAVRFRHSPRLRRGDGCRACCLFPPSFGHARHLAGPLADLADDLADMMIREGPSGPPVNESDTPATLTGS